MFCFELCATKKKATQCFIEQEPGTMKTLLQNYDKLFTRLPFYKPEY